jgi:AcrR family transcriptional regulator
MPPGPQDMDNPMSSLPPTAQRLVAAARRLLERDGFNAITVEAVAKEAGAYRDSVRYYFGDKAGLVAAVVDSLAHDQSLESSRETRDLPSGGQRIHALVAADRRLAEDSASFRDFFSILPHVLQDEELRGRVAALYDWYRELYVRCFEDGAPAGGRQELVGYASLMVAVIDGLAVQKAIDPQGVDLEALFGLWERLLRATLDGEVEPT